jgi:hypothetical protein
MADDNTLRSYRPNDPSRREAASVGGRDRSNDPLVELARLIGQNDPFADVGRGNARDLDAHDDGQEDVRQNSRQENPAPPPTADWRGTPPPYALMRSRVASPPPVVAMPRDDYADRYAPRHTPEPHADSEFGNTDSDHAEAARQAPAGYDETHYDDTSYAAAAQDGDHDVSCYDNGTAEPQDEPIYDDPPPRGRSGMLTALTLIGCAMIGTAGAYGYRHYHSNSVPSAAPVIVADKTPTKIVPATDPQSSKVIQDRVSDAAPAERVVPREEQPVILKVPTPPAVLAVAPTPASPESTASIASLAAAAPPAAEATPPATVAPAHSAAAAPSEPKRIRTVTIRSDGSDASTRPVGASSTAVRTAPATKGSRGGPLQLDPLAEAPAVAAPARPVTPPAPRLASAPTGGDAGGYVVQVSSQRTQSEAEASFRAMQTKYPSAFSGRSPIIRRADLGAKGVFYRAVVGPFANSGDAGHFCSSLKAAGGQCIVQKN